MPTAQAREERHVPRAVIPQRQIRQAIETGDFELHYQPIIKLGSGRIAAIEALLRMRTIAGTLLFPDEFLPAVAHTPVMHDLTAWVVDRACAQASALGTWNVAVNVAAADVVRPALVDAVADALKRHDLPPQRLTVELTEHAAVQGMRRAIEVLERLRALGVGLSLDDFGTGYSSLLYLRDLPVTQVKIDRTFVSGIGSTDDDAAIVRSVVQLAHKVGLTVVAEGVEHEEQLSFLRNEQCDFVQGHLFAVAAPIGQVPRQIDLAILERPSTAPRRTRFPREPLSDEARDRISVLTSQGASLHTIAAGLNRDGLLTPAGTRWTAATVARAMSGH